MTNNTTAPDLIKRLRETFFRFESGHDITQEAADALEAAQARIAELERRLGGGCDANNGGEHTVLSQGKYKYCANCGESLRGIRYCHEPRAALQEGKG